MEIKRSYGIIAALGIVVAAIAFLAASGHLSSNNNSAANFPSCGNETQFFTALPTNLSNIASITPLGNLNPPAHVFPTSHIYVGLKPSQGGAPVNSSLYAPGNVTITTISSNPTGQHTEYTIYFYACGQFFAYYDHVITLSPELKSLFTPPFETCINSTYSGQQQCYKSVDIPVKAGQYIGDVGGPMAPPAFDFGAVDYRAAQIPFANASDYNNQSLHYVCPLDYYAVNMSGELSQLIGMTGRTALPLCGTISQDIAGTAQGNWFPAGSNFANENLEAAIALVHENINTSEAVFSVGTAMESFGLQSGLYPFAPRNSGAINLDFRYVKPGTVYCYQTNYGFGGFNSSAPTKTILIRLLDNSTLRVGLLPGSNGSCGVGPWNFTNGQWADFQR